MSSRHAAAGRKPISSVSSREAHFLKKAFPNMFGWLIRRKAQTQVTPPAPTSERQAPKVEANPKAASTLKTETRSFSLERVRLQNAMGFKVSHDDLPDSFPLHYFTKRPLPNGSIALFPGTWAAETLEINLPIRTTEQADAQEAGAQVENESALIDLRKVDKIPAELDLFLPLFAKSEIQPLMIDMIPETSFGASLANILTQGSWNALRLEATARSGGCCQVCGDKPQSIECHELWEYHTPKRRDAVSDTRGVQTLVALLSLCKACHRMFHPGRADAHGQSDEVWERIAWANRWTGEQTAAYSRIVQKIWQRRSAITWDLDLRLVRNWELVVRKAKVNMLDDGRLQDLISDRITGLLGVNWRFSKESEFQKSLPLPDWLTV
ncbi:hypothetical protein [Roseibium algicola]|nr:hypothetical protein [Roseibium aggregatum]